MSENITQTIRNLEALANRPGTIAEGELAKTKAIELSKKHSIPSIFTQPNYVPPIKPKPFRPTPPKPQVLHPKVLAMQAAMKMQGWEFSHYRGARIYKCASRPSEEIHMVAHFYGEFECQHFYIPTGKYRQAGKNAQELDEFFNSISYRYQLWPDSEYKEESNDDSFYTWAPEPIEIWRENQDGEEPKPEEETEPERIDIIDEMLGQKVYKKHYRPRGGC